MAMKYISDIQVLQALEDRKKLDKFPYEILAERTGQPEKVCYRAMERCVDRGYVEYGVSLRTSWLTESGIKYLIENRDNYVK